jgi:hypothetical protein
MPASGVPVRSNSSAARGVEIWRWADAGQGIAFRERLAAQHPDDPRNTCDDAVQGRSLIACRCAANGQHQVETTMVPVELAERTFIFSP